MRSHSRAGPTHCDKMINEVVKARFSTGYKSAATAGEIVMTAEPPIPAKRRIAIKLGMVGANEL